MRGVKIIVAAGLVAVASLGLVACSSDSDSSSSSSDTKASTTTTTAKCDNTIVDTAAGNADFSTLVSAVQQADLVDTLNAEGPYTVFAPTNAAFAKIDPATLQGILGDKEKLTKILTYHVLGSKVTSSDLQPTQTVATVEGSDVTITADASGAKINDANITTTDIETCNGVIHVIDTVLVPPDA
jgi:uncharacterized surface protein with fasciclin (FAS1) repeats